MSDQCDLFDGSYRSLNDILEICKKLNFTGGVNPDGSFQTLPFEIQFFKDLAFVALFDGENIEMAVYLHAIDDDLTKYVIYKIDGLLFSTIELRANLRFVYDLLRALENKEVFVRS